MANVPFSFASVEAALIATYGIAPADHGRFRARVTFLQRGGLFDPEHRPGKGARLTYQPDMLHRLIFCLELAELGVSPSVQLELVHQLWDKRIQKIFDKAESALIHGGDDVILLMVGVNLMTGGWSDAVPNINNATLSELPAKLALAMRPHGKGDPLRPRALIVNLTRRLEIFHAALADVHLKFEQPTIEGTDSVSRQRSEPSRAGKIKAGADRRASRRRQRKGK